MATDILVLDPDRNDREACEHALLSLGYHPIVTAHLENALRVLKSQKLALLLTDVHPLAECGGELLRSARDAHPPIPVVVLTGVETIEAAVQTLRRGALFYLLKPVSPDQFKVALGRAVITRFSGRCSETRMRTPAQEHFRRNYRRCEPSYTTSARYYGASRSFEREYSALRRIRYWKGTVCADHSCL
jgi:DNA-binding NtrC family response regulator